ncbi:WD repeat-containing protein 55-like protein [Aphelenchoides bicaudatus]|nr:WD repeat-containing protein 55-like protein [Aphelenchoides bicaudatus]
MTTVDETSEGRRNLIFPPFQAHPAYTKKISSYSIIEDGIKNLRSYRLFRDNTARINHMDFSHDGKLLITSSDDDSMIVYDSDKATKLQTVNSKKYGSCLIQFASDNKSVLHGSSKVDHTIRYLSIDNKQYIRYFAEHKNRVRSLSMSPVDECFLSCSLDNTMKLWDLRATNSQANMKNNSPAVAAFDRDGMVFGVALASKDLKLFDIRNIDKGPFSSITLPAECTGEVSNIQFSPNNRLVAIGTRSDEFYLVDTFEPKFPAQIERTPE